MKDYGKNSYLSIAFHPILFGILPVILLYATNFNDVSFDETYRAFLVTLGIAMVLFLAFRLCLRDWHRAGLILSVFFFFLYNFRSILIVFVKICRSYNFLAFQIVTTLSVAGIVLIILLLARWKIKAKSFTPILNVMAVFLIAYNLCSIGAHVVQASLPPTGKPAANPANAETMMGLMSEKEEKPDIYYIILDCYVRADVFQELYGRENTEFIQYLRSKGFYVADQSHSNYTQTFLSVTSSLNMQYLNNLVALDPNRVDRDPLQPHLQQSAVLTTFKKLGYKVYTFESGYSMVDIPSSDVFIRSEPVFNQFEHELVTNTLAILFENNVRMLTTPKQMLNRLDQLDQLEAEEGPKFVYAHLLLPHPPFLFDRDGNLSVKSISFDDGYDNAGSRENYQAGYSEQMFYANKRMIQLIDRILAHPDRKSIIILQGDHGSGVNLYRDSPEETCYRERMSILNAYYFPGGGKEMLYPDITPVNTFRVVLNAYFNANIPLAPDHSYFSTWEKPYTFYEASEDRLNQRCPAN